MSAAAAAPGHPEAESTQTLAQTVVGDFSYAGQLAGLPLGSPYST